MDISVVLPTYQRANLVHEAVSALLGQCTELLYEVIVVIDGSTDNTWELLQKEFQNSVTLIEQPNSGASIARNSGAKKAKGKILLFLDDDMIAEPNLLNEHWKNHEQGFDVVFGHIPLHPDTDDNIVSKWVGDWALERVNVIKLLDGAVPFNEMMTGQLSISKVLFDSLEGFEKKFTDAGEFGNEDIDFGLRLLQCEAKIVFNENAISWQKYSVPIGVFLRRQRECGRADVLLSSLHKEIDGPVHMADYQPTSSWMWRLMYYPVKIFIFISFALNWNFNGFVEKLLNKLINYEYGMGVEEAGGFRRGITNSAV